MIKQKDGLKIGSNFYVKPISMNFFDYDDVYNKDQRFLMVNYLLIQDGKEKPAVFNAYAYWEVEKLNKKYKTSNKSEIKKAHFNAIEKDDYFYVEGVLVSEAPIGIKGGLAIDAVNFIKGIRNKDKEEGSTTDLQSLFETDIMINRIHKGREEHKKITQQSLDLVRELLNSIGEEIEILDKDKNEKSELLDGLSEGTKKKEEEVANRPGSNMHDTDNVYNKKELTEEESEALVKEKIKKHIEEEVAETEEDDLLEM